MTKIEPTQVAVQAIRQLFAVNREPSRRVLVDMYENDWNRISKVKDELDLSWKEFFHAIVLWLDAFEADADTQQVVANLVRQGAGQR